MTAPFLLPEDLPADDPVLEQLAALEQICFGKDAWSRDMLLSSLRQPFAHVWAVKNIQMSKIIAYAILYLAGDEGDIANLAVLPAYRKRGVGGTLLDTMLQQAWKEQIHTVFLEVRVSNAPAIRLYASRNFQIIGKRKNYYQNPREDALLMAKAVFS